jgi:hypothetical protein
VIRMISGIPSNILDLDIFQEWVCVIIFIRLLCHASFVLTIWKKNQKSYCTKKKKSKKNQYIKSTILYNIKKKPKNKTCAVDGGDVICVQFQGIQEFAISHEGFLQKQVSLPVC